MFAPLICGLLIWRWFVLNFLILRGIVVRYDVWFVVELFALLFLLGWLLYLCMVLVCLCLWLLSWFLFWLFACYACLGIIVLYYSLCWSLRFWFAGWFGCLIWVGLDCFVWLWWIVVLCLDVVLFGSGFGFILYYWLLICLFKYCVVLFIVNRLFSLWVFIVVWFLNVSLHAGELFYLFVAFYFRLFDLRLFDYGWCWFAAGWCIAVAVLGLGLLMFSS